MNQRDSAYIHTDLACERHRADTTLTGVDYREETIGAIKKSTLRVSDAEGAREIQKPIGSYITLSFEPLWRQSDEELSAIALALADVLKELCPVKEESTLLVAGLGNRRMTVDAVGPSVTARIIATKHLAELEPSIFASLDCHRITTVTPGVLAETGIESAALILGAVRAARPDFLIAVDALVARDPSRLASTIQVSNTGILPGAGVGNPRAAVDEESLGIPVIVIGIPTVVESRTMLYDALTSAGMEEIPPEAEQALEKGRGFFVSPRECDTVTENVSAVIADAVNLAFGINSKKT